MSKGAMICGSADDKAAFLEDGCRVWKLKKVKQNLTTARKAVYNLRLS
jgi:hypothetical protein